MRGIIGFGLVVLLAGPALATPVLRIKNGSTVRMSVKGKREAGVGVRPKNGVCRVELSAGKETAGQTSDQTIEIVDVTDGASSAKWELAPTEGALLLDADRFVAGHGYRVTVMRGQEAMASTLNYLYPPPMTGKGKVTFEDGETGGPGEDEIAVTKKPSL